MLFLIDESTNVSLTSFESTGLKNYLFQITHSNVDLIDKLKIDRLQQGIVIKESVVHMISNSSFTRNGGVAVKVGGAISIYNSIVNVKNSTF